jgi:GMP synthase (glutamine-hydrolysing)
MDLSVLKRHPYPGPGLAIRIIGEVTRQKVDVVRQANAIIEEEIQKTEYAQRLWQFFAILTGVSTTGIRGDARAYGDTIAIRAVESIDVMSATAAELPYELLFHLSRRITTEVKGVNRVVYDITSKPPGTIEWE